MNAEIFVTVVVLALSLVANITLGAVVLLRNTGNPLNRSFFALTITAALWVFTNLLFIITNSTLQYVLALLSYGAAAALALSFLAYCLELIHVNHATKKYTSIFVIGLGVVVASMLPGVIASGVTADDTLITNTLPLNIYGLYLLIYFGVGIIVLLRARVHAYAAERNKITIILLGLALAAIVGLFFNLLLSIFGEYGFVKFGPIASLILVATSTYAIIRHQLFDIRLAAVRTIAYILALGTLAAIYYIFVYLASVVLLGGEAQTSLSVSPVNIFLALFMAFIFQPVKKFFDRVTNNIFFRDTYKSDDFFARLSELLASSTELRGLLERAALEIASTLKSEQAFFFIYYSNGVNHHMSAGTPRHSRIPLADARVLDEYYKDYGQVILTEMLPENAKIRPVLISHKIELLMPLTSGNRVVGYVCLGDRRSGTFTKRDLKVLATISDELVIAIQNALSVHEVKEINATLQQRIDVATKELRESNAQLQRLDVAKDEFVSMASHQLRTPLTSVKGYISMLLDGDAGKLTETQQKLLEEAFKSSERMVGLISDFLSVSRVQTGRFVIEMRQTDLSQIVKQEVESLREMAHSHDLSLTLTAPKKPVMVQLDEEKIRQIIMNFIDNAVYYSHAGGKINVSLEIEDDDAVLRVTDSGIGVPEKEQAKLFSKFYRASNARKQRPDGTGVGLYLAKKVIVGHHGKLVFTSEEGKGSTFGFSLPVLTDDQINEANNNNTNTENNTAGN